MHQEDDYVEPPDMDEILAEEAINQKMWLEEAEPVYLRDVALQRQILPPWLFADWIRQQTLVMVSAEPFAGKSMLMLALSASLDLSSPLFGSIMPAEDQRVLYLGQDSPTWDYNFQYQKLSRGYLGGETYPQYWNSMALFNRGLDLTEPKLFTTIKEGVKLFDFTVVMFDTLLEFHPLDENSNPEMKRVMSVLKRMRDELRLTVIFSHHTGKLMPGAQRSANYRARGATSIAGSVDQNLLLFGRPNGFRVRIPKRRGGSVSKNEDIHVSFEEEIRAGEPELRLVLADDPNAGREAVVLLALASGPQTRQQLIAAFRSAHPDWTAEQAAYRTGNSLRFLKLKGKIESAGHGSWQLVRGREGA